MIVKTLKTKIVKDEDGEYTVQLWRNGAHYEPADYFTDDKQDAKGTAVAMLENARQIYGVAK